MKAKLLNFVALDLGSSKIAAVAANIDKKGEAKILTYSLYHSLGIKCGAITDLHAAENSIINTIYALEKNYNKNIKQVSVAISGAGTHSYYISHKIRISNQTVTELDVKRLLQKMLTDSELKDQEIINYFPLEFVIDEHNVVDNPIGLFGKDLSCRLHIITANTSILMDIVNCFAKYQIEVNNITLAVYATAIACLSKEERSLGVVVIDIGARTTSVGVFLADKLIYTSYIPLGSWHITSDIAKIFSVSMNTAEKLKVIHGAAITLPYDQDHIINTEDFESENQYHNNLVLTQRQLNTVINSRIEEILLLAKAQCDQAEVNHLIARQIVFTGGGSNLRSLKELAIIIFDKQVRIAKPNHLADFIEIPAYLVEAPDTNMYSAAIGIVHDQSMKQKKQFNGINNLNIKDSSLTKFWHWIKANI